MPMNPSKKEKTFAIQSVLGQVLADGEIPGLIRDFGGIDEMSEAELREVLEQIGVESAEAEEVVKLITSNK